MKFAFDCIKNQCQVMRAMRCGNRTKRAMLCGYKGNTRLYNIQTTR